MTDNGNAFHPLGTHPNLERVHLWGPVFAGLDSFQSMFNPNLKSLELWSVSFCSSECESEITPGVVSAIVSLHSLVGLHQQGASSRIRI